MLRRQLLAMCHAAPSPSPSWRADPPLGPELQLLTMLLPPSEAPRIVLMLVRPYDLEYGQTVLSCASLAFRVPCKHQEKGAFVSGGAGGQEGTGELSHVPSTNLKSSKLLPESLHLRCQLPVDLLRRHGCCACRHGGNSAANLQGAPHSVGVARPKECTLNRPGGHRTLHMAALMQHSSGVRCSACATATLWLL